jgi:hypothetical protein
MPEVVCGVCGTHQSVGLFEEFDCEACGARALREPSDD